MGNDLRHAGVHWPENAGGEHPSVEAILALPGISQGCTLICSPSARYWYRQARGASPLVVWRAIPRRGRLPAQLGWEPNRVADECLNLWDEQPHHGAEWFLPLNELQFEREAGMPFPGYGPMAEHLGRLRLQLRRKFTQKHPKSTVRMMFPAWVPQDDGDRLDDWQSEAAQWDAICLHCYGDAETMQTRYLSYRSAFPNHPIFVGEWNSNHGGHDERASLEMWRDVANADPLFLGATYYIWETDNDGERDLSIWGNPARLALFQEVPPVATNRETYEPVARAAAQRAGIDADRFVRQIAQESGFNPQAHNAGSGAAGIAQIVERFHPNVNPWEPKAALDYAANLMASHLKKYDGDWALALSCYNAGPGATASGLKGTLPGWPYSETVQYVANILQIGQDEARRRLTGAASVPNVLPFNPDAPVDQQPDDWSCSIQAVQWLLRAIGRNPDQSNPQGDPWLRSQLVPSHVTPELGLLDASGQQLAAWVTSEYGREMLFAAQASPVTFDDVLAGAGVNPMMAGGRRYGPGGHWVGIRRGSGDTLEIANPALGFDGIRDRLTRAEWDARAPWSCIWIDRLSTLQSPPIPAPIPTPIPPLPPDPRDERIKELTTALGYVSGDVANVLQAEADAIRERLGALEAAINTLREHKP